MSLASETWHVQARTERFILPTRPPETMAAVRFTPDATETKVLQALVERGLAKDLAGAARLAVVIAGASTGILGSGPSLPSAGRHGASADEAQDAPDEDDALEGRGRPAKTNVAASAAALRSLRPGKPSKSRKRR